MSVTLNQKFQKRPTHVFDIFLFIDPIDPLCQQCTKQVIDVIDALEQKTYFHIVPYQTLHTVDTFLKRYQLPTHDLCLRNSIYQLSYLISLSYKAANFQGKKKARQFLNYLTCYSHDLLNNSSEHIAKAAQLADLDITMLYEDTHSQAIKDLYRKDQLMARKFSITSTPSMIIFNSGQDDGILLTDNLLSIDFIQDIIANNYFDFMKVKHS
ncbi:MULTISPECIES: DsbA family protein [unclassified Granulicatella]|uniref:DsbA family protein n=1 Tax=unclassified Granulicatella TaxID=2630493 RepID=UPI00107418B7|nr:MULTISPECIES: DsbA family protein [unclassified Granulicatella]MBF0779607.1 DsbA family protein [Granulicatella sp. 19428wC4_WM01]TFU96406.1 hypothetical protein E4T68_00720 [Granulicatella sp. WM01]